MNQQSEVPQPENKGERAETLRREGVTIPTLSFWHIRSGTGRTEIFNPSQAYPYTTTLEQILGEKKASPRGSSLADIAEFARDEQGIGFRPTKSIPYVFAREIDAIQKEAAAAAKRGESLPRAYQMYRAFLEGSDLDVRIDEDPQNMRSFAEQLVGRFATNPKLREKVNVETVDGKTTWTIPTDDLIAMIPRDRVATATSGNDMRNLFIQVTYREFRDSGIPACDWKLIARGRSFYPPLSEMADLPLISVGISPKAERLTAEQRALDSRMGPKVNTYDQIDDTLLTSDLEKLPEGARQDFQDTTHLDGLTTTSHGLVTFPKGVYRPEIIREANGQSHCDLNGIPQSFIALKPEQFATLDKPVGFGSDFGRTLSGNTLVEGVRTLRKALRYNGLEESPNTERARTIIASRQLRDALTGEMSAENPSWWQDDVAREVATAAWFAPQEIIRMGAADQYNLAQFFPRWHYLARIADQLPTKADIEARIHTYQQAGKVVIENPVSIVGGLMHGEIRSMSGLMQALESKGEEKREAAAYVQGGWKFIIDRLRKAYPDDPEIAERKNDLELLFWVLAVE